MSAAGAGVVVVCGSRKPAPGREGRSAARELLKPVLAGIVQAGVVPSVFDLREMELPLFDGRTGGEYGCPDLDRLTAALDSAPVVLFSVPAYWQAPSGPLVNLLDVLGGAAYDRPPGLPAPFLGKTALQLVVGADPASAYVGAGISRDMLAALGFTVDAREVVVADPRAVQDVRALTTSLRELGGHAAALVGAGSPAPSIPEGAR
ncbi:NAD(P)H-dependent oxidoreductase [Streptomyces sp. NPDC001668]|uniref:NAD(P)H-dependent oxidoreductase n=1 Tax=unclassified Streptomyces TaxID=2593676 RepID=UPI0034035220